MTEKIIEFVSYDEGSVEHWPPVPASKMIPDWYKDIPTWLNKEEGYIHTDGVPSIKRCIPVRDYLTSGYIIRNVFHINSRVSNDEMGYTRLEGMCNNSEYLAAHPHQQCPIKIDNKKYHYFKFVQPWKVITPPGYSCMFFQPFYTFNDKFTLFPAIVDTDKHEDSVNFVGIAKQDFEIFPGDPLMVVMPFKRDDWRADIKYYDYKSDSIYRIFTKKFWHGTYAKYFHSKKHFR
jgi:hypothetical protein